MAEATTPNMIDFDTTIAALQQDLTTIPTADAIALIESWQQQLQGNDIAEDLGELKQALISGTSGKGESIGAIMTDLGEDTAELAANASGDVAAKARQLAELLQRTGKSLQ